jgi:hypothetical protein
VPFTSPLEVYESDDVVSIRTHAPPATGARSIAYEVMADPPLSVGAVHASATSPLPATARTVAGQPGTVHGVTFTVDADPRPPAVMGTTLTTD